jgi:hypothetical protein
VTDTDNKSFKKIQTSYWYNYVHSKLFEEVVLCLEEFIDTLQSKPQLSRSEKSDLKKANNKMLTYQRKGLSIAELQKRINEKELAYKKGVWASRADGGLGLFSGKDWSKYKKATRLATVDVADKMDVLIAGSKNAFINGPCSLFKIFKAINVRDAVFYLSEAVVELLIQSPRHWEKDEHIVKMVNILMMYYGLPLTIAKASDQHSSIDKLLASLFNLHIDESDKALLNEFHSGKVKWISEDHKAHLLSLRFDNNFQNPAYFSIQNIACIYIGHSYIGSKFFGDSIIHARNCFIRGYLKVIEETYDIPQSFWFASTQQDRSKILEEFNVAVDCAREYYAPQLRENGIDLDKLLGQ